jgi:hypothetical protein
VGLTPTKGSPLEFGRGAIQRVRIRSYGRAPNGVDRRLRLRMTQSQVMEHLAKTVDISRKDAKLRKLRSSPASLAGPF